MVDHPASSFALGYLAAGSATELANDVAMTIVHGRWTAPVQVDMNALWAENQALRNHIAYLQSENSRIQKYADELRAWGRGLYDELDEMKKR